MSIQKDPSLYGSDFERNANDAYYTEPRVCTALVKFLPPRIKTYWEPCCGRGDLAGVLQYAGLRGYMSDLDVSHVHPGARKMKIPVEQCNFLTEAPTWIPDAQIDLIATNPPFGDDAEKVIRHALTFERIRCFAFLLRNEWNHGSSRIDLFRKQPFAKEIVLTWRPRWDWWLTEEQKLAARIKANIQRVAAGKKPKGLDEPDGSPRHNFSWFIWDREHKGPPTTVFALRKECDA